MVGYVKAMQQLTSGLVYRSLLISREAKVAQYLISGHIVNPSLGIRSRLPVAHGPETRHYTPSALCECMGQGILIDARRLTQDAQGGVSQFCTACH